MKLFKKLVLKAICLAATCNANGGEVQIQILRDQKTIVNIHSVRLSIAGGRYRTMQPNGNNKYSIRGMHIIPGATLRFRLCARDGSVVLIKYDTTKGDGMDADEQIKQLNARITKSAELKESLWKVMDCVEELPTISETDRLEIVEIQAAVACCIRAISRHGNHLKDVRFSLQPVSFIGLDDSRDKQPPPPPPREPERRSDKKDIGPPWDKMKTECSD